MALGREIERLRRLPVFACLDEEALRLLAFSAETRRLPAGHVLFRRGEPADAAVLLVSGTLSLDAEHAGELLVSRAWPGTLLNETALFASGIQTVTASAQEASTVVSVARMLMLRVLEVYPHNAPALRHHCAVRLGGRLAAFRAAVPS